MIELAGLTKRYGEKVAVDDLTFTVRPGTVTGFLGPNGAGKSTTMRMILGLDHPTGGSVRIDGRQYHELKDPLTYIGALLDAKAVHGGRSAYHHLLCLAQSNGIPTARVHEVLETVGLTAVARKKAKGFSLGMSQRLGIAGALLGDPRILMFDEPVNGLDPEGIHWIRSLMQSLAAQGRTVFVSSHLMSEMALTAGHLVVIGQGRLLADTSMADFIERNARSRVRVRTPDRERLLDALHGAGIQAVESGDGALEVDGGRSEEIGELAARHQVVLHELSTRQSSLEEAFMRLTASSVEYHAHAEPAERRWGADWDGRTAAGPGPGSGRGAGPHAGPGTAPHAGPGAGPDAGPGAGPYAGPEESAARTTVEG